MTIIFVLLSLVVGFALGWAIKGKRMNLHERPLEFSEYLAKKYKIRMQYSLVGQTTPTLPKTENENP